MAHDGIMTSEVGAPPGSRLSRRHRNMVAVAALTCYSTAVSWQAQLVSYPLFRAVGADDFRAYHQAYNEAIPLVVIVPGFLGFLACTAFPWTRPPEVSRWLAGIVGLSGIGAILTTVLWAIPRHDTLDRIGQDAATIDSLLQANAVRTAVLTIGAAALLWGVLKTMAARLGPG